MSGWASMMLRRPAHDVMIVDDDYGYFREHGCLPSCRTELALDVDGRKAGFASRMK